MVLRYNVSCVSASFFLVQPVWESLAVNAAWQHWGAAYRAAPYNLPPPPLHLPTCPSPSPPDPSPSCLEAGTGADARTAAGSQRTAVEPAAAVGAVAAGLGEVRG